MSGEDKGYVDPLLSGYCVDYSSLQRKGLVGHRLAPRVMVDKPDEKFAKFGLSNLSVPDSKLARNGGRSRRIRTSSSKEPIQLEAYGLEDSYDINDARFKEGPFVRKEKSISRTLVNKLDVNQEARIRDKALNVAERNETLSGTGEEINNKWFNGGGQPLEKIDRIKEKILVDPNLCILSKDVWIALKNHPVLLDQIGLGNKVKKLSIEMLSEILDVETILIATGIVGPAKLKKTEPDVTQIGRIWQNCMVLAYVDEANNSIDSMRAMSSFQMKFPQSGNTGYVVSKWDDLRSGVQGERVVKVATQTDEQVVAPELIYALKGLV